MSTESTDTSRPRTEDRSARRVTRADALLNGEVGLILHELRNARVLRESSLQERVRGGRWTRGEFGHALDVAESRGQLRRRPLGFVGLPEVAPEGAPKAGADTPEVPAQSHSQRLAREVHRLLEGPAEEIAPAEQWPL